MVGSFPIELGVNDRDKLWIDTIEACIGDYLSQGSLFGKAETVVKARTLASLNKLCESLTTEFNPSTSVDMINDWCNRLGVEIDPDDTIQELRDKCAEKYELNLGASQYKIITKIDDLLGDCLDDSVYYKGIEWGYNIDGSTFNPQPATTYSPYFNVLTDPATAISTDYQVSDRCHFIIHVSRPSTVSEEDFYKLLESDLPKLLSWLAPCWVTWEWIES